VPEDGGAAGARRPAGQPAAATGGRHRDPVPRPGRALLHRTDIHVIHSGRGGNRVASGTHGPAPPRPLPRPAPSPPKRGDQRGGGADPRRAPRGGGKRGGKDGGGPPPPAPRPWPAPPPPRPAPGPGG